VQAATDEGSSVARAWAAFESGDLPGAARLWRGIRNSFPANESGYLGAGLASRRAQAFHHADELYRVALEKFPDSVAVHTEYAWCAEECGDTPAAISRWRMVRSRFPEVPGGPIRVGVLLRDGGRFDEADRVLGEAVARFPDNLDAANAYAWVAHHRRDWEEALKRWEQVISRFNQSQEGRRGAAQVLLELGRLGEAVNVLSPALRMFPDDPNLAALNGWLATRRRDIAEAERVWRDMRVRFPDNLDGYFGWAIALREESRLDEAEAMLLEAARRFPDNTMIAMDLARIPERGQNWELATRRWREVTARFPSIAQAHIGLGNSLLSAGEIPAAREVLRRGRRRFADDPDVAIAEAEAASREQSWPEALELWAGVLRDFPGNPDGYAGFGRALRDCGQLERSTAELTAARQRFPKELELEIELALTLSRRREWAQALSLWESLKRRHPSSNDVRTGIAAILDHALADQSTTTGVSFTIPPLLLAGDDSASEHVSSLNALFKRFESLGDTCEFGIVQRMFQVEHVSLLRWAQTSPSNLIEALNRQFEGVGDPEHTIVAVNDDEYVTQDRRYYMFSHTFTPPASEPIELFAPEQCRRMQWLRRRLLDGLRAAARVFVYKCDDGLSDAEVQGLRAALLRYSPDITLLCVRLQESGHASGTVERIDRNLFVGYLDRFSTVNISVSAWISLCRQVAAALDGASLSPKVAQS
jgi:tetratricopeptide (TPR) repeat protein